MKRHLSFFLAALVAWPVTILAAEPADVDVLIRELRAIKIERRAQAAEALGQLGSAAAPAVRALTAGLYDPSPVVKIEVLVALRHIGPAARGAVPDLVKIIQGEDSDLYIGGIEALGAIGPDAAAAAPALIELLKGDDEGVAVSAGLALSRILPDGSDGLKEAVPVLAQALRNEDVGIRSDAVAALATVGKVALPALIDLVAEWKTDGDSAWHAAAALTAMGPVAEPAVPALAAALKSNREEIVIHAAGALGAIGPAAKNAVPQLQKLLASKNAVIRTHVASALGDLGPAAEGAVGDLSALLEEPNAEVRRESAEALGKIGPAAKTAVHALLGALEDDAGAVTVHAALALSRIGPEAVPELIEALKDEPTRQLIVAILGDIGEPAKGAVETLTGYLADPKLDPEFGREVLLALAKIGPEAKAAIPALIKILEDEEHPLRAGAAFALAKLGAKQKEVTRLLIIELPKEDDSEMHAVAPIALVLLNLENDAMVSLALPRLIDLLGDDSNRVRHEAATTLALLGSRAADAVPRLALGLRDADPAIRGEFLATLGAIGPEAAEAFPAILKALADPDLHVQYSATYTIGKIGAVANDAVPLLETNLQARDELLRIASAWALVHVDTKRRGLAKLCLGPLTRGLSLADPRARTDVVEALGLLGRDAGPAVPALEKLSTDPDETVRKAAATALKKINR